MYAPSNRGILGKVTIYVYLRGFPGEQSLHQTEKYAAQPNFGQHSLDVGMLNMVKDLFEVKYNEESQNVAMDYPIMGYPCRGNVLKNMSTQNKTSLLLAN